MRPGVETDALRARCGPELLHASQVSFGFPGGPPVINRVCFSLRKNSLAALIGANGSGKSTLIRLLAGLLRPVDGEIFLERVPLSCLPRQQAARRIGYVPQSNPMVFPFTALEVVLTGRTPHTSRFQFESESDRNKALEALAAVEADHLAQRPVTELSGGERQRVVFARALAQEPECLLLDEPSSALDLKHRARFLRLLQQLREQKGLSALVATHDLQLLDPGFDTVCALWCGEIVAEGPVSSVLRDKILGRVYEDPHIRARRLGHRTFVWSEG